MFSGSQPNHHELFCGLRFRNKANRLQESPNTYRKVALRKRSRSNFRNSGHLARKECNINGINLILNNAIVYLNFLIYQMRSLEKHNPAVIFPNFAKFYCDIPFSQSFTAIFPLKSKFQTITPLFWDTMA